MTDLFLTASKASEAIKQALEQQISKVLKKLLEEKHLYQSLEVELPESVAAIVRSSPGTHQGRNLHKELQFHADALLSARWYLLSPVGSYAVSNDHCSVAVPHVKTFCTK